MQVGQASIELRLNRTKFDAEIANLKQTKLEPINVRVKIDAADFERQIKGLEGFLPTLSIPVEADLTKLKSQLKKLDLDCIPVELCFDEAKFKRKIKAINLDCIPVDICPDFKKFDKNFRSHLKKTSYSAKLDTSIDSGGFTDDLTNSLTKAIKNASSKGIFGSIASLITAPFKLVGSALSTTISGVFLGIGEPIGNQVSKSITKGVEDSLSDVIGSFDSVGEAIGKKVASGIEDALAASGFTGTITKQFEELVGVGEIARVSSTKKRNKEKQQQRQNKVARAEFREQQREQFKQNPELLTIPGQIKTRKSELIKERDGILSQVATVNTGKTNKRIQELRGKKQLNDSEVAELEKLSGSLQQDVSKQFKRLQEVNEEFQALEKQEKELNAIIDRPIQALAATGDKNAQRILKLRKELEVLRKQKQQSLAAFGKKSKLKQATPEDTKNLQSQISSIRDREKKSQTEIDNLLRDVIVPEELTTPQQKQKFFAQRGANAANEELSNLASVEQQSRQNISNFQQKRVDTQPKIQRSSQLFELIPEGEDELKVAAKFTDQLIRLESAYKRGISTLDKLLESPEKTAKDAANKIKKIREDSKRQALAVRSKIDKQEISAEEGNALIDAIIADSNQKIQQQESIRTKARERIPTTAKAASEKISQIEKARDSALRESEISISKRRDLNSSEKASLVESEKIRITASSDAQISEQKKIGKADIDRTKRLTKAKEELKNKFAEKSVKVRSEGQAFELFPEIVERLNRINQEYRNGVEKLNKKIQEAEAEAQSALNKANLIKEKRSSVFEKNQQRVNSGEITQEQADADTRKFFEDTQPIIDKQAKIGKDALKSRQEAEVLKKGLRQRANQKANNAQSDENISTFIPQLEARINRNTEAYKRGLTVFAKKISEQEQIAAVAIKEVNNLNSSKKAEQLEVLKLAQSGEVSQEEGGKRLEEISAKFQPLIQEQTGIGKAALAEKNRLTEAKNLQREKTLSANKPLQEKVQKIGGFLSSPAAKTSVEIVANYKQLTDTAEKLIEKEIKLLEKVLKKRAVLQAKLQTLQSVLDQEENKSTKKTTAKTESQTPEVSAAYAEVIKQVSGIAGVKINPKDIPSLIPVEGYGSDRATYNSQVNGIKLDPQRIENLNKGVIDKNLVEDLVHELRHALQADFGRDSNSNSVSQTQLSESESRAIEKRVGYSVDAAIKKTGKPKESEYIKKVRQLEEDAYGFALQNLETVYRELKQILGSPPESVNQFKKSLSDLQQISLPQAEKSQDLSFKTNEELVEFARKNLNAKGVKELARRSGVEAASDSKANKEFLIGSLKFTDLETVNKQISTLGQDAFLAKSEFKGKAKSNKLTQEKEIISRFKDNRKQLAESLKLLESLSLKDAEELGFELVKTAKEQLRLLNELSQNYQIESGQAVAGIRSQLTNIVGQAQENIDAAIEQTSRELSNQVSPRPSNQDLPQNLELQSLRSPVSQPNLTPEQSKRLKELEKQVNSKKSKLQTPPPPPNFQKKLRELEQEILDIDPLLEARVKALKKEVNLEQDAASIGAERSISVSGKSLQDLEEEVEINSARRESGLPTPPPPPNPPSPTKTTEQELQQLAGQLGVTLKGQSPQTNTALLKAEVTYRKALLNLQNTVDKQTKIKALEILDGALNQLASFEKGYEQAEVARNRTQEVGNLLQQSPEQLRERARNATFTKSRYLLENSTAINTLVADKANKSPTAANQERVQRFNNKRGELAELINAYNDAPSETGFKEIRKTVKEVEKTLKELGVPLKDVNKLLDQYNEEIREMQGQGLVPLDFDLPQASEFPPLVDFFDNFGEAAARVIGPLSKIGPLIKGFISFTALEFIRNQLVDISKAAFQTFVEFDKLRTGINFASGSSFAGAKNLQFVSQVVDDLKIPLRAAQKGFNSLAIATKGSALQGKETRKAFEGISDVSTVLSLSEEDTGGVSRALSQIATKGKLSTEELLQLAERGVPSFALAARAIGVTGNELSRLLQSGQILSQDFLPKFSRQLKAEFGDAAKDAAGNAQSAIFALDNAVLELQTGIGEGISPAFSTGLSLAAEVVKGLTAISTELGIILGSLVAVLGVKAVASLVAFTKALILTKAAGGTLSQGLGALANTVNNSFTAKLSVGIFAVLEVINLLNKAVNTDLVKSFKESGDAAKRAAEESRKAFENAPGEKRESLTPQSSSGIGRNIDNFLINPLNTGLSKLPLPEKGIKRDVANFALSTLNPFVGAAASQEKLTTFGELERDTVKQAISGDVANRDELIAGLTLQLAELRTGKGTLGKLPQIDKQLLTAEEDRAILQGQIERDFERKGLGVPAEFVQELQRQNELISKLNDQRADISTPLTLNISRLNKAIESYKSQIESLKNEDAVAALGGDEAAAEQQKILQKQLDDLRKVKAEAEKTLASLKVNPVLAFTTEISKLNRELSQTQESINFEFTENSTRNIKEQFKEFESSNLASINTPLRNAIAEKDRANAERDAIEKAFNQAQTATNARSFQPTLRKFGLESNSSVTDIDSAISKTSDDADKKVLETLKQTAQLRQQLSEANNKAAQAEFTVTEAVQTRTIALVEKSAVKQQSVIERTESNKLASIQKALEDRKITESQAAEATARIQLRTTENQNRNLQNRLSILRQYRDMGKIGAEEFANRERDLLTQVAATEKTIIDQRLAVRQAFVQRAVEQAEFQNQKETATINQEFSQSQNQNKQNLISGNITKKEFENQSTQGEVNNAVKLQGDIQRRLQQNEELRKKGIRTDQEAAKNKLQLNTELAQSENTITDLILKQQQQRRQQALEALQLANKVAESNLQLDTTNKSNTVKSKIASGDIDEKSAAKQQLQIEAESIKQRQRLIKNEISQNKDNLDKKLIDRKTYTENELTLNQKLADTNTQLFEKEIARKKQILDNFQDQNKRRELNIQITATTDSNRIKSGVLSGNINQKEAAQQQLDLEISNLQKRQQLIKDEIAQNQSNRDQKLIDAKTFTDTELTLNQKLADSNTQLLDKQIEQQKRVQEELEKTAELKKRQLDLEAAQINKAKENLGLLSQALDSIEKLSASRFNLVQANTDASLTQDGIKQDNASRALELSKKLQDENLAPGVKDVVNSQLNELGFGNNELEILQQRQQIEADISAKKIAALQQEQQFKQQSLEFDLKRQMIAATISLFEAEGVKLAAKKSQIDAASQLRKAKQSGDELAIQSAEIGVTLANQELDLAGKKIDIAKANLSIQKELSANALASQKAQQGAALAQEQAAQSSARQARELERAELAAGNKAKVENQNNNNQASAPANNTSQRKLPKFKSMFEASRYKLFGIIPGEDNISAARRQMTGVDNLSDEQREYAAGAPNPLAKFSDNHREVRVNKVLNNITPDISKKVKETEVKPQEKGMGGKLIDGLKEANKGIEARLEKLSNSIVALAKNPRSLTVNSPQPVDDAAKILNDIARNGVAAAGL